MSRLHMAIAAIALPVLLVGGFLLLRAEQIMLGGQAYVFGFPLVIMDLTRIDQSAGIDPANPLGRHALGSHDALASNPDGSLDLWLQAGPPAPALRGNWLPVRPDAPFQLLLRLYGPQPAALDGRWTPLAVQRMD